MKDTMRNLRNSYQEPQVIKKGGFTGKLVSLVLGFAIGVVGAFGGVAGTAYYLGEQPLNEAANTIDSYTGIGLSALLFGTEDEKGLLDSSYSEKYVKDLFGDTLTAITDLSQGGTLAAFNKISPKVEELLEKLLETTEKYGIPITVE